MRRNKGSNTKALISALLTIVSVLATPISVYAGSEVINDLVTEAYIF